MCFKRQKLYTCGCVSLFRTEMCIDAVRSWPVVCTEPELKPQQVSHFPCYNCIRAEVAAEKAAVEKERVQKEKLEMEKRAKEEIERAEKGGWQKLGRKTWAESALGKG